MAKTTVRRRARRVNRSARRQQDDQQHDDQQHAAGADPQQAQSDAAIAAKLGDGDFARGAVRLAKGLLSEGITPDDVHRRLAAAAIVAATTDTPPRTLSIDAARRQATGFLRAASRQQPDGEHQGGDAAGMAADFAGALHPELAPALDALDGLDGRDPFALQAALRALLTAAGDDAQLRVLARIAAVKRLEGAMGSRAAGQAVNLVFAEAEPQSNNTQGKGTSAAPIAGVISYDDDDPAADPVDLDELLTNIYDFVAARVHLAHAALITVALWVVHTYLIACVRLTPYLAIASPTKRCGKSTLLDVLALLAYRPQPAANATPAAIFRLIAAFRPTLLLDEADRWLDGKNANPDLIAITNAGNKRDTPVLRTVGDDHEPASFDVFCPKAIAAIGTLPDTIVDRSIVISMRRKPVSVKTQRITRADNAVARALRARLVRWVADHTDMVAAIDLDAVWLPDTLNDRARNGWEPLAAIASFGGPNWVEESIKAAKTVSTAADDVDAPGVLLLRDIKRIFDAYKVAQIASLSVCSYLAESDGGTSPWARWHPRAQSDADRRIQPTDLASLLKPFGVEHRKLRVGTQTPWGYRFKDLAKAFEAYVAPETAAPGDDDDADDDNDE